MNVREYFERAFPGHHYAEARGAADLESMPLESTCGDDCKAAIDAAAAMADQVRKAFGTYKPLLLKQLADTAVAVCGCFICG